MTGYRSEFFRYHCSDRGCYYDTLPDWGDLIECFPRRIRPTDIDGMVEINGRFLFLEQKQAGAGPDEGQRRALIALSALPSVTVAFFRATPVAEHLQVLIFPEPQGWQEVTRDWFKGWLREWAAAAEEALV